MNCKLWKSRYWPLIFGIFAFTSLDSKQSSAGGANLFTCDHGSIPNDVTEALDAAWASRKKDMKTSYPNLRHTDPKANPPYDYYNADMIYGITDNLWPVAQFARRCENRALIDEIAQVLNLIPLPRGTNGIWLKYGKVESPLGSSQFLGIIAFELNEISKIPVLEHTPEERKFVRRFMGNLVFSNLSRWLTTQAVIDLTGLVFESCPLGSLGGFGGGGGFGNSDGRNLYNAYYRVLSLLPPQNGPNGTTIGGELYLSGRARFCKAIHDTDKLILMIAAEVVSAYDHFNQATRPSSNPSIASYFDEIRVSLNGFSRTTTLAEPISLITALRNHVENGRTLYRLHMHAGQAKDLAGRTVPTLTLDEGQWADHPGFKYVGQLTPGELISDYPNRGDANRHLILGGDYPADCASPRRGLQATPTKGAATAAMDIGHTNREAWVTSSLNEVRSRADQFPTAEEIHRIAANYAYRVQNRQLPVFSNLSDGSRGWFMVQSTAFDHCGISTIHAYPPDSLNYAILYGFATWPHQDLRNSIARVLKECHLLPKSPGGTVPAYCDYYPSALTPASALMALPNMVDAL